MHARAESPSSVQPPFSPIEDVLADLRAGKMVILTDDEDRENEGDLVLPAQFVSPQAITFMLQHAMGYLCLSLTDDACDRLGLVPQATTNTSVRGTAFTVSIDLHPRYGGTTGVSAKERARCIEMAIDPRYGPDDFVRPGHVNPLRARDGGVLVRAGQTEGSIDLCKLAGLAPAAIIIEVMKPDGEMARVPDLARFCVQHGLKMCSVAQIIEHRLARESLVRRLAPVEGRPLRTPWGTFRAFAYASAVDPLPHLVLAMGDVGAGAGDDTPTLVRMHRRNLLGDVFHDLDASPDGPSAGVLHESMRMIAQAGRGAVVYLRTSGEASDTSAAVSATPPHDALEATLQALRPTGLGILGAGKAGTSATAPTSAGAADSDTPNLAKAAQAAMPLREYGVGGQILRDLGLRKLRLITNSRRELPGLDAFGLEVVERVGTGREQRGLE